MTAEVPFVRVVVVNYDGGDVTRRCIDALLATDHPADRLEVVVVDNASVDGLNWILQEHYPQVTLIQSDVNEGFARGCNLALRDLGGADVAALINNDAIVTPNWLRPLLEVLGSDPKIGAVSPKLLLNVHAHAVLVRPAATHALPDLRTVGVMVRSVRVGGRDVTGEVRFDERFHHENPLDAGRWTKGLASMWWPVEPDAVADDVELELSAEVPTAVTIGAPDDAVTVTVGRTPVTVTVTTSRTVRILNSAGGGLYHGWYGGDRGFLEPDLGQYDEPAEVFSWCGGAVALRADYLRDVGIFDPAYFLYYEDFDLAWRGRSAGWTYRYEPSSVVLHEHAYSSKAGSDFFTFWVHRNRRLTLVKNAPAKVATRAVLGAFAESARMLRRHVVSQLRRLRPPAPRVVLRDLKPVTSLLAALPGALGSRRRLASRRVVSHADIERWTITK